MPFFQRKGSKTYHTKTACSRVPRNVKTNKDWTARGSKPRGKLCIECAAKDKPKAKPKPKKRVTRKKTVARKRKPARKKVVRRRKKR
ncbi:MAG: hypothetical protein JSU81_06310 [Candidatus Coatesbacteria bacterium]|nr:MAG: hypothetical protein JSU81_06310 [Candidatus Coatesbacteria bacterium]